MTDPNLEVDLHRALTEGTDHLRSPDLADRALAGAARTRTRRTTLGALALVVLIGAGVTWAAQDRVPRADVVDTPSPTPSPTPTAPVTPVETNEARMGTQPLWDPFTVVDAPRGDTVLPQRLDPPSTPVSVYDEPVPAVVVAWPVEGHDLRLLSTDGEWLSVPGTDSLAASTLKDVVSPAISSNGRLVAFSAEDGLWVVDVSTGDRQVLPWPEEIAGPWDTLPGLRWMPGDEALLVLHWRTPWIVGLDGSDGSAAYLGRYTSLVAIDPVGPLLQRRFRRGNIVEWRDGVVVRRVDDTIAWGERMVAGHGMVAITGGLGGGTFAGPIVIDTTTGERVAYAPIRDRSSVYSDNGYLTAQGFLDEDTVLLLVGPMDFRTMDPGEEQWHLVAWHFRTGDFELLTSGEHAMRGIEVAPALVDASP